MLESLLLMFLMVCDAVKFVTRLLLISLFHIFMILLILFSCIILPLSFWYFSENIGFITIRTLLLFVFNVILFIVIVPYAISLIEKIVDSISRNYRKNKDIIATIKAKHDER